MSVIKLWYNKSFIIQNCYKGFSKLRLKYFLKITTQILKLLRINRLSL